MANWVRFLTRNDKMSAKKGGRFLNTGSYFGSYFELRYHPICGLLLSAKPYTDFLKKYAAISLKSNVDIDQLL